VIASLRNRVEKIEQAKLKEIKEISVKPVK
jgi:hypothetical protein